MKSIAREKALALRLILVVLGAGGCGSSSDLGPPPLVLDRTPTENGDQQNGPVGALLEHNLRVIVTRDGVPESGVSVAWSAVMGTVTTVTATTGADGISAASWMLSLVPGAQTAQAAVSGATGSPVTFTATAIPNEPPLPQPPPPPPLSPLAMAQAPTESGDGQTGPVGAPLGKDLRVIVTRDGVAQSGVTVTWATADGSLDPSSSVTDPAGIGASRWTLGATEGSQTATAAVTGATGSPVSFTATATASVPPPPPPPPPPTQVQVTVGNNFFKSVRNGTADPAVDTVAVNGTVTWTWTATGTDRHSVESTGLPSFTSSAILTGNGQTYSFKFTQGGTYSYDCQVHGSSMTGRIVVR